MEISQAMREIGDLGNTHGAAIQETCEFLAFGELPHFYRVFDDFSRATRSRTLLRETVQTQTILETVRELYATARPMIDARGLTLVGISVGNLGTQEFVQLELPFDEIDRASLDSALDTIRDRYGSASVTRGVLVGKDPGLTMPMLPD